MNRITAVIRWFHIPGYWATALAGSMAVLFLGLLLLVSIAALV